MRVLIADDDPTSILLLQCALSEWGYEPIAVRDGDAAWAALSHSDAPPLAILDWMMPGLDGPEVCRRVRLEGQAPYVYLILLTGRSGTHDVVSGIESGADDYISKPFHEQELRARLRSGQRIVELQAALRFQASHDALTGLLSRGAVLDDFQRELARSSRQGHPLGVLLVDIDHFKRLNDTYGHMAGDAALREVARRMTQAIRPYDALGRYGGEEFLAVLSNCGLDAASVAAERLRRAIDATPVATPTGDLAVTVSIGALAALGSSTDADTLIRKADEALYRAKRAGRNRVEIAVDCAAQRLL